MELETSVQNSRTFPRSPKFSILPQRLWKVIADVSAMKDVQSLTLVDLLIRMSKCVDLPDHDPLFSFCRKMRKAVA